MVGGFGQRCFSGGVEEENTPEGRRPDQPVGEDTPKLRMEKQRKELQCLSKRYPFLEKLRLAMGATRVGRLRQELEVQLVQAKILQCLALREETERLMYCVEGPAREPAYKQEVQMQHIYQVIPSMEICWQASPQKIKLVRDMLVSVGAGERQQPSIRERALREVNSDPGPFEHDVGLFSKACECGWSLRLAITLWAPAPYGAYDASGMHFIVHNAQYEQKSLSYLIQAELGLIITVFVHNDSITQISASKPIRGGYSIMCPVTRAVFRKGQDGGMVALPLVSRFSPPACKIGTDAHGNFVEPRLRVGSLYDALGTWERRLGSLSPQVRAFLRGEGVLPKAMYPFWGMWLSNLTSWDASKEAQEALWPVFATWSNAGILEYVAPHERQPLFILPLGAVAKGSFPWWRLITDGRPVNENLSKWPSKCTSLRALALMLLPRAFTSSYDIHDAFHIGPVSGCLAQPLAGTAVFPNIRKRTELVCRCKCTNMEEPCPGRKWYYRQHTYFGCTPAVNECRGTCDKSLFGLQVSGHVYRIVSQQFGISTSQSVLYTILRPVVRKIEQATEAEMAQWVDDLLEIINQLLAHVGCRGYLGGCNECKRTFLVAVAAHVYIIALLRDLNIPQTVEKSRSPAQRGEYTGVIHDTVLERFFIPDKKLVKFVTAAESILHEDMFTPRILAGLRGKTVHYCNTIMYLQPFITALSVVIGTVSYPSADKKFKWDEVRHKAANQILDLLATEIVRIITKWAPFGKHIWPQVASSLYGLFVENRLPTNIKACALTFDASWRGYGVGLAPAPEYDIINHVGAIPDGLEQVHRESYAGIQALLMLEHWAVRANVDLKGYFVIFRGDCAPALATMIAGSYQSQILQQHAMEFNTIAERLEIYPLTLHISGAMMIEEGFDDLSRDQAAEVAGPCVSPLMKAAAFRLATRFGWSITIDLFAAKENAIVPRFASRFYDFQCEHINAMLMPSWAKSECPHCSVARGGQDRGHVSHREVCFAFLPLAFPLDQFIIKAQYDGFQGIVVVPAFRTDEKWKCIRRAMVADEKYASVVFGTAKKH